MDKNVFFDGYFPKDLICLENCIQQQFCDIPTTRNLRVENSFEYVVHLLHVCFECERVNKNMRISENRKFTALEILTGEQRKPSAGPPSFGLMHSPRSSKFSGESDLTGEKKCATFSSCVPNHSTPWPKFKMCPVGPALATAAAEANKIKLQRTHEE